MPEQVAEFLEPVAFSRDAHVVLSALAGVTIAEVRAAVGVDVPVIRAIPMPPVRNRAVATVVTPQHPTATAIFDVLGGTLPVADEAALSVFSSVTGAVSGYLKYLAVVCSWAESQGVPREDAERFLRDLFAGLSPAIKDTNTPMEQVVSDHETPGGLNGSCGRPSSRRRALRRCRRRSMSSTPVSPDPEPPVVSEPHAHVSQLRPRRDAAASSR